jgi:hypothetical protein
VPSQALKGRRHQPYKGEKPARPDRIIVHVSTANPAEVSAESAFASQLAGASATAEQIEDPLVGSSIALQEIELGVPFGRVILYKPTPQS